VTETPPPRAFFRIGGDRLWMRPTLYGPEGLPITPRQVAALRAAVFGAAPSRLTDPPWLDHTPRHSIYVAGPVPDPADRGRTLAAYHSGSSRPYRRGSSDRQDDESPSAAI